MDILNLNRTNDAVFKTIFANQQHKDITLSLINAVFEFQGTGQMQDITFIDRELDDYVRGRLTITAAECQALKQYASQYPKPDSPAIHYISANSVQSYKNRFPVVGTPGQGVNILHPHQLGISSQAWKNAVAFETYQDDKFVRATMVGTGSETNETTLVPYPEGSTRVEAVAWDGQRTLVYGRR